MKLIRWVYLCLERSI